MSDQWEKQAERVRELARDPHCRAYFIARLLEDLAATDVADLVEGALLYRERFGDRGNHRHTVPDEVTAAYYLGRLDEAAAWLDQVERDELRRRN